MYSHVNDVAFWKGLVVAAVVFEKDLLGVLGLLGLLGVLGVLD